MSSENRYFYESKEVPYNGAILILYTISKDGALETIQYYNTITQETSKLMAPKGLKFGFLKTFKETTPSEFESLISSQRGSK